MNLVLKVILALLQALPAVLDLFNRRQTEQKHAKTKERIEADPIAEFEREFGSVSADEPAGAADKDLSGTQTQSNSDAASRAR